MKTPLSICIVILLTALGAATAAESQNLLQNATFDNGSAAPWVNGTFSTQDSLGLAGSGSIQTTNNAATPFTFVSIVSECIPVTGGAAFERLFDYRLVASAGVTGSAKLNAGWYSNANCSGFINVSGSSGGGTIADGAFHRTSDSPINAPPNAQSMNIRLEVTKTQAGGSIAANFDNVVIKRSGTCANLPDVLCITHDRFRVEAIWQTSTSIGPARTVKLTSDTGYLWFFSPQNVEAVVKVIDGCSLNNRYWVFMGGLTDVRTEITVTDSKTGATKVYTSTIGQPFQPIQDTSAFATCP